MRDEGMIIITVEESRLRTLSSLMPFSRLRKHIQEGDRMHVLDSLSPIHAIIS